MMDRHEIRIIGPLKGEGEVFDQGQPIAHVSYALQETENVALSQDHEGTHYGPAHRDIRGTVTCLQGEPLLGREHLVLLLADGRRFCILAPNRSRQTYGGRDTYVVRQQGGFLTDEG